MKLLCVGIKEVDAGKTTVTLAIMRYLKQHGERVGGFKPRASNNVWYDWKIVEKALKHGTVYGHDAKLLSEESTDTPSITLINPVHRLWLPNSPTFSQGIPNFLLDRITAEKGDTIIVNKRQEFPVDKQYFDKLFSRSEVYNVSKRKDLNSVTNLYNDADAWANDLLSERFDSLVYESYSDIGMPWQGISDLDYVFAVGPFHLSIYEGTRYLKAFEVVSLFPEEEKTARLVKNLQPLKTINIPPFSTQIVHKVKEHLTPPLTELLSE